MFSAIFVAITPFLVSGITQLVKQLPSFAEMRLARRPVIRVLAGVISLLYIMFTMWMNPEMTQGGALTDTLTALGLSVGAWLSSVGAYHTLSDK